MERAIVHKIVHKEDRKKLKELVTSEEVAKALRLHPKTVRRLAYKKIIPAVKIGRNYRFDLDEVITTLKQRSAAEGLMKAIGGTK